MGVVLAAIGGSSLLVFQPTMEKKGERQRSPQQVASEPGAAQPTESSDRSMAPARPFPSIADRRSLGIQPARGTVGFIVDRAALSWLPREFALEEGDAILRIDGEAITSSDQLIDAVKGSSEGSAVEFQIRIAGTTESVSYSVAR